MATPPFDRRAIPPQACETLWVADDGWQIRRIDWKVPDASRKAQHGSILFFPGRGDAYEKYLETLNHWASLGWRVTAADWRGQAGSGRLGADAVTGHIDDFSTWTGDLAALWHEWRATTPGPHVLAGHSMGGHLCLRAAAEGLVAPDGLLLCAPMLGFVPDAAPRWLMHGLARLMAGLGDRCRPAWKWSEKPGVVPADRAALLTHDAARYADELWWRAQRPALVMGPGSWGWVERAYASMAALFARGKLESIAVPVLIMAASADRLVGYGAIARAATRLPDCELVRFGPEAAHELLRETDPVRDRALAACDRFLASLARG